MSALVDWGLAERVAHLAAGESRAEPAFGELLAPASREATDAVLAYTRLVPREPLPEAEWVDRREWSSINLETLRLALDPVAERLLGDGVLPAGASALPLAVLARVAAVQVGALVGYASRQVLGQYEFPILGSPRAPRLLFVGANVAEARDRLDAEPERLLRWIALHEVTHAVHFAATPWLREHLGRLAEGLLAEGRIAPSPGELLAAARRLLGRDPLELLRELRGSDPLTLLTPAESRRRVEEVQSTMAAIEGFAEHVMDEAAPLLDERVEELRAATEERRANRSLPARLLGWLLGLELKLRQYREGKRFADEVVAAGGIEALNRAWESPEKLPRSAEIADAGAWLRRVRAPALPAATA